MSLQSSRLPAPRAKDGLDARRQAVLRAGVDDSAHVERRRVDLHDPMIGTVDEVVEVELPLRAVLPLELLVDLVDGAANLMVDVLVAIGVLLHQTIIAVDQGAVLLLDEQHVTAAVDDDEVDLAEVGPPGIFARPVDPVEDGEVVGKTLLQEGQRRQLGIRCAGESQLGHVRREDSSHGIHSTFKRRREGRDTPRLMTRRLCATGGLTMTRSTFRQPAFRAAVLRVVVVQREDRVPGTDRGGL